MTPYTDLSFGHQGVPLVFIHLDGGAETLHLVLHLLSGQWRLVSSDGVLDEALAL